MAGAVLRTGNRAGGQDTEKPLRMITIIQMFGEVIARTSPPSAFVIFQIAREIV